MNMTKDNLDVLKAVMKKIGAVSYAEAMRHLLHEWKEREEKNVQGR